MKKVFQIPVITFPLLIALAQPVSAQSSGSGSNTGSMSGSTNGTGSTSGSISGSTSDTSTSNDATMGSGSTSTDSTSNNDTGPTQTKKSGLTKSGKKSHCAANEDHVKEGGRVVCVPRSTSGTSDSGLPTSTDQSNEATQPGNSSSGSNP